MSELGIILTLYELVANVMEKDKHRQQSLEAQRALEAHAYLCRASSSVPAARMSGSWRGSA